ncbi:MAG: NUDIX hydrolase [Patescibacteria group bacterium]|nr:NUDIX hydrolase [Patescibacteria group bacterium]
MRKKIIQKIVLAGVVYKNTKILIVKRHNNEKIFPGMWELPSGKKEPLEDWRQGLIREVQEETALKVKVLIPVSVFSYVIEKKDIRDTTQINFLVKPFPLAQQVKLSSEHSDYAWLKENKIENYNLSKKTKQVIKDSFKIINKFYKNG